MIELKNKIINWLKEYSKNSKTKSFIIGVSGGIDSALTSTLCAMTGQETFLISMPIYQNKAHLTRANNHIDNLKKRFSNVESLEFDLTNVFNLLIDKFEVEDSLAEANSRARLRMVCLYHLASINNGFA